MSSKAVAPQVLYMAALKNEFLFPHQTSLLSVTRPETIRMLEDSVARRQTTLAAVTVIGESGPHPGTRVCEVGSTARLMKLTRFPDAHLDALFEGVARFAIESFDHTGPCSKVRGKLLADPVVLEARTHKRDVETYAMLARAREAFERIAAGEPSVPAELRAKIREATEVGQIADLIASESGLELSERESLLKTFDLKERLRLLLRFLAKRLVDLGR